VNQEPISIDEMKVRHLIADKTYLEIDGQHTMVLQGNVYWLVDNQWWEYPRMSKAKAKTLIGK
jgi:hypothetical protein